MGLATFLRLGSFLQRKVVTFFQACITGVVSFFGWILRFFRSPSVRRQATARVHPFPASAEHLVRIRSIQDEILRLLKVLSAGVELCQDTVLRQAAKKEITTFEKNIQRDPESLLPITEWTCVLSVLFFHMVSVFSRITQVEVDERDPKDGIPGMLLHMHQLQEEALRSGTEGQSAIALLQFLVDFKEKAVFFERHEQLFWEYCNSGLNQEKLFAEIQTIIFHETPQVLEAFLEKVLRYIQEVVKPRKAVLAQEEARLREIQAQQALEEDKAALLARKQLLVERVQAKRDGIIRELGRLMHPIAGALPPVYRKYVKNVETAVSRIEQQPIESLEESQLNTAVERIEVLFPEVAFETRRKQFVDLYKEGRLHAHMQEIERVFVNLAVTEQAQDTAEHRMRA